MQASIESRLEFAGKACRNLGPVAECCRIAVFITCFLAYTDTWANPLVPCKMSQILHTKLYDSTYSSAWLHRRDLQMWLLLVGSSVSLRNKGQVEDLDKKWTDLLTRFRVYYSETASREIDRSCLARVLEDFIYFEGCKQQRWNLRAWGELEALLSSEQIECCQYGQEKHTSEIETLRTLPATINSTIRQEQRG